MQFFSLTQTRPSEECGPEAGCLAEGPVQTDTLSQAAN